MGGEEERGEGRRGAKRGRGEGTYIITVHTIIAERICSIEYLHNVKIKSCHT